MVWVSGHSQIAVKSERRQTDRQTDRHFTRRPTRISERKSSDIYRSQNGRYRAARKYKTHSKRHTSSQSRDLKETQTKPNAPDIYAMHTFPRFIHLHLISLRNAPHASELQYTTVYHSGSPVCLPFEHWNRGSGPHSRGRCAPASYLPLYCPL
jgi:hypothetical protein